MGKVDIEGIGGSDGTYYRWKKSMAVGAWTRPRGDEGIDRIVVGRYVVILPRWLYN
jgi:hypothetical protein